MDNRNLDADPNCYRYRSDDHYGHNYTLGYPDSNRSYGYLYANRHGNRYGYSDSLGNGYNHNHQCPDYDGLCSSNNYDYNGPPEPYCHSNDDGYSHNDHTSGHGNCYSDSNSFCYKHLY